MLGQIKGTAKSPVKEPKRDPNHYKPKRVGNVVWTSSYGTTGHAPKHGMGALK